jgi:hypothetical protein
MNRYLTLFTRYLNDREYPGHSRARANQRCAGADSQNPMVWKFLNSGLTRNGMVSIKNRRIRNEVV